MFEDILVIGSALGVILLSYYWFIVRGYKNIEQNIDKIELKAREEYQDELGDDNRQDDPAKTLKKKEKKEVTSKEKMIRERRKVEKN